MSASQKKKVGVLAAGLSFLVLGYAVAQQVETKEQIRSDRSQPGASGQTDRSSNDLPTARRGEQPYSESAQPRTANFRGPNATAGGQNQVVDHFLAACLLAKNQGEVQLGEIAQQKSENAEVKQFAEKMIQDHKKLIEQLQPLAGMQGGASRGVSGSLGTRTETERSTATDATTNRNDTTSLPGSPAAGQTIPPTGTTAAAPRLDSTTESNTTVATTERMGAGGAIHQLMQIDKQINDRCLQAVKEELQQKSGAEFDKCYVGSAIGAHMHAVAALEVIGQQSQGQLAQVAKHAQPTVQQHLDHAKQLMKQLEGQTGATGSTAERKTTTRTE